MCKDLHVHVFVKPPALLGGVRNCHAKGHWFNEPCSLCNENVRKCLPSLFLIEKLQGIIPMFHRSGGYIGIIFVCLSISHPSVSHYLSYWLLVAVANYCQSGLRVGNVLVTFSDSFSFTKNAGKCVRHAGTWLGYVTSNCIKVNLAAMMVNLMQKKPQHICRELHNFFCTNL